jgi:hypothetical protein
MNLRKAWLYEALKDMPGLDPAILESLRPSVKTPIGRSSADRVSWPHRNGKDIRLQADQHFQVRYL